MVVPRHIGKQLIPILLLILLKNSYIETGIYHHTFFRRKRVKTFIQNAHTGAVSFVAVAAPVCAQCQIRYRL